MLVMMFLLCFVKLFLGLFELFVFDIFFNWIFFFVLKVFLLVVDIF